MATTNNVVRVTKSQKFDGAIALLEGKSPIVIPATEDKAGVTMDAQYLIDFFKSEQALLAKKNAKKSDGEPTEAQKKNEEYKGLILDFLASLPDGEGATCTDLIKGIPAFVNEDGTPFNTSRVSSLTTALVNEGRIIRQKPKKGRTPFTLA